MLVYHVLYHILSWDSTMSKAPYKKLTSSDTSRCRLRNEKCTRLLVSEPLATVTYFLQQVCTL